MSEEDNLNQFSELFASSICLVDESALQVQSPIHDEVQLPSMGIFQDGFNDVPVMYENKESYTGAKFHSHNFEPTRSEIESNQYAERFNHSSIPSNPEGLVVEHATGMSSSIEAGCSYLETPDDLGHQAVTQFGDENSYMCIVCGKTFKLMSPLYTHLISHAVESFVGESALQLHSKSHDAVELNSMGFFHERFKAVRDMNEKQVAHDSAELYLENPESTDSENEWYFSDESFNHSSTQSNPEGLAIKQTSSSDQAGCSYLETRDDLDHQAVAQHGDEKTHPCNVCGKTFKIKRNLGMHLKSHGSQKPHTCDICNKSFKRKTNLKRHKLTHVNERTFQCDICNAGFKKSWDLVIHKLIHSNETLYKCDICNKNFKAKRHLTYHEIMHSDHRPYECDVCNRRFKRIWNLRRHKLFHDKESKMNATSVAHPLKRHFI